MSDLVFRASEEDIEDANDLLCPDCKNFKFNCSCKK